MALGGYRCFHLCIFSFNFGIIGGVMKDWIKERMEFSKRYRAKNEAERKQLLKHELMHYGLNPNKETLNRIKELLKGEEE